MEKHLKISNLKQTKYGLKINLTEKQRKQYQMLLQSTKIHWNNRESEKNAETSNVLSAIFFQFEYCHSQQLTNAHTHAYGCAFVIVNPTKRHNWCYALDSSNYRSAQMHYECRGICFAAMILFCSEMKIKCNRFIKRKIITGCFVFLTNTRHHRRVCIAQTEWYTFIWIWLVYAVLIHTYLSVVINNLSRKKMWKDFDVDAKNKRESIQDKLIGTIYSFQIQTNHILSLTMFNLLS